MELKDKTIIGSGGATGVGDLIGLTAICRHLRCVVELPESRADMASLFNSIADVKIVDNPTFVPDSPLYSHFIEQKAIQFSLTKETHNLLPFVNLFQPEIAYVRYMLSDVKNPIAIAPNTSLRWAGVRQMEVNKWQEIVYKLKEKGYSVMQFGTNKNTSTLAEVMPMLNMGLRIEALFYHVIGKLICHNSGPHHLGIAAGARVLCLNPNDSGQFQSAAWNYDEGFWKFTPNRVKYINYQQGNAVENVVSLLNFLET
jgi:hypothetical protein